MSSCEAFQVKIFGMPFCSGVSNKIKHRMKQVLFRKDLDFTSAFKQQNPHLCSHTAGHGDVGKPGYVGSYTETKIMPLIQKPNFFILTL